MSELIKKIFGQLVDTDSNHLSQLPFGITIEFTKTLSSDNPGGWIGSAPVKTSGQFDLFTAYDMSVNETISYRIFKDEQQVTQGTASVVDYEVNIAIDDAVYQYLMASYVSGSVKIKGAVTLGEENIAAIPVDTDKAFIEVRKTLFREEQVITKTIIDKDGNYAFDLPFSLLGLSEATENQALDIFLTLTTKTINESGEEIKAIIEKTANVVFSEEYTQVDIHTDQQDVFGFFKTEIDHVAEKIADAVGIERPDLNTIITDGEASEIAFIAKKSGLEYKLVNTLASAARIAADLSIPLNHSYVLVKENGPEKELWQLTAGVIHDQISRNIAAYIIPSGDSEEVTADAIMELEKETLFNAVSQNGDRMGDVFNGIINDISAVKDFLLLNATYKHLSFDAFWDIIEDELPTYREKLQKGIQVLSLNGMQPEMAAATLDLLQSRENYPFITADLNDDIRSLTLLKEEDWSDLIDYVSESSDKLCVPLNIAAEAEIDGEDPKDEYANKLLEVVSNVFATTVIQNKLDATLDKHYDSAFANMFGAEKDNLMLFLGSNPDFDFRTSSLWDFDAEEVPFRTVALPVQNMMRLTVGKPEVVAALIKDGLQSSADIVGMSQDAFVKKYAVDTDIMSQSDAMTLYAKADTVNLQTSNAMTSFAGTNSFSTTVWDSFNLSTYLQGNPGPSTDPDWQTLFGSLDLCNCAECTSMYSPAAYYTDILNFTRTKTENTTPSKAYKELTDRRRPDLTHIELSCKNTNTALPYVDLVNELLELAILKANSVVIPFKSYQTTGSALELSAYPEHTYKNTGGDYVSDVSYKQVYDNYLKNDVSAPSLPFNLALEESRTYLQHLGYKRYDLMDQFKPVNAVLNINAITSFNLAAEWLGVTRENAQIIVKAHASSSSPWLFYGYSAAGTSPNLWYQELCNGATIAGQAQGLNTLLEKAAITYKELLQLLNCRFLNPEITFTPSAPGSSATTMPTLVIKAVNTAPVDTCDLTKLQLRYSKDVFVNGVSASETNSVKEAFFNKLYRFIRLQKATGWGPYQLDMIAKSLNYTDFDTQDNFIQIVKVHYLASKLKIAPEKLSAFWSPLSTEQYINYNGDSQDKLPSVYDSLFRNKSIINPPDVEFNNPLSFPSTATYSAKSGILIAAMNIKEEELFAILDFLDIDAASVITLSRLSLVYAFAQLAVALRYTIADLNRLLELNGINATDFTGTPLTLLALVKTINDFVTEKKNVVFSLDELEYLLDNKDPNKNYIPGNDVIQLFYTALRTELKKQAGNLEALSTPADSIASLKNIIIQFFAAQYGVDNDTADIFLKETEIEATSGNTPSHYALVDALTVTDYINGSADLDINGAISAYSFSKLYDAYKLIAKAVFLVKKYKLSADEIRFFIQEAGVLNIPELNNLPTSLPINGMATFVHLNDWMKVKGVTGLRVTEFIELMRKASGLQIPDSSPAAFYTKQDWINFLQDYNSWKQEDIEAAVGASSSGGALNVQYTNDYKYGSLILQLNTMMNAVKRIGLGATTILAALQSNIVMDDAAAIRKAAKAKYNDEAWAKIAKPLQDTLREKQRAAMVAYILARPNMLDNNNSLVTLANKERCKTENDLFAYLLIDVEMKPCMLTSRIKQGISSVQLYLDRVILNLENYLNNVNDHIVMLPPAVEQWKAWRNWYRVWEANRKIFLYPENWIEPELRDDKTPIFKELETALLQDEVKDDKVEDAYRTYLEGLEEIGHLEPVGIFRQQEGPLPTPRFVMEGTLPKYSVDITHVFGRTSALPHRYYYRRLENNTWTPWEKITVDIKSDHITPAMWNGKLYLFWLTFQRKKLSDAALEAAKTDVGRNSKKFRFNELQGNGAANDPILNWANIMTSTIITPGTGLSSDADENKLFQDLDNSSYTDWEITLNWSQYKDNKWLANEQSDDTMNMNVSRAIIGRVPINDFIQNWSNYKSVIDWLTNHKEVKIDEFFKSRLYLFQSIDRIMSMNDLSANEEANGLTFSVMFAPGLDETATGIHRFLWRGDNHLAPYVSRTTNGGERGYQLISPWGTRLNKMKFVEDPFKGGKLWEDKIQFSGDSATPNAPVSYNTYFSFESNEKETFPGIVRKSADSKVILNDTNQFGTYMITARASRDADVHSHYHIPIANEFLYQDDKNTYYAQLGERDITLNYSGFSLMSRVNEYKFQTFYHAQIGKFIKNLNKAGLSGLLKIENQKQTDNMNFGTPGSNNGAYKPTTRVHPDVPTDKVQFKFTDAYGVYNWEIFFHAPMLIAQRLSDNQQFEEAQKWYHYIFNPTSTTNIITQYTGGKERFWKFYPFYEQATSTQQVQTLTDLLLAINANNAEANAEVAQWEKNPFNPHLIARMRVLAYMKNVLMKYIDNLIAWGDQLFRRDTIESINEATQLYVLAANLLGKKPQEIPARAASKKYAFDDFLANGFTLDALSNVRVPIESFFPANVGNSVTTSGTASGAVNDKMFYFCLPKNDILLGYWGTVADRLFKIRNCMNIEGLVRQLPLFEPPIDPALLVKATAMGVDINTILDSASNVGLPHYRFSYMLQKANEFCGEVRGLGSSLLLAIEKKDAEQLALLRSGQELQLMEKVTFIKEQQVADAEQAVEALKRTKENTELRFQYYSSRPFTNSNEQKYLASIQTGLVLQAVQGGLQTATSSISSMPTIHAQAMSSGTSFGGLQMTNVLSATSAAVGIAAAINNAKGSMAVTMGGYERRRDDWTFQADTASKELEQLDVQILGAEIRLDIARKELANHEQQVENTTATDTFMRSKFTNQELYSWMVSQVSTTYFQSYQLAYDLAKKADQCYKYELTLAKRPATGFITFGYWDSLRKGLMCGEKLQFDLRKMEASYIEENKRELELTKNVSLVLNDPLQLIELRKNGSCDIFIPEELYDLDYPGHYNRRIKSVSISIPCVAGPYTTIPATLTLASSYLRKDDSVENGSLGDLEQDMFTAGNTVIATSTGQNDAGVFELNFRDERYLPFEGKGAISKWNLTLTEPVSDDEDDYKQVRTFDFDTISDIILHIRYTAVQSENQSFKQAKINNIGSLFESTLSSSYDSSWPDGLILPRYFSLKHEFSNDWYKGLNSFTTSVGHTMNLNLLRQQFPAYTNGLPITISSIDFIVKPKVEDDTNYYLSYNGTSHLIGDNAELSSGLSALSFSVEDTQKTFAFKLYKGTIGTPVKINESDIEDIFFIINYKLS